MSEKTNKAGSTHTTNQEIIKRETGEHNVPPETMKNPGHTSPTPDDLEHPEHRADKQDHRDKAAMKKVEKTNKE